MARGKIFVPSVPLHRPNESLPLYRRFQHLDSSGVSPRLALPFRMAAVQNSVHDIEMYVTGHHDE